MKHLYFIRHGQSDMNAAGVWSGHSDTPLSALGHAQAQQTAATLKNQGISFDVIISSPLKRAHHTAIYMAKATGHPEDKIVLRDDCRERYFGVLEGTADEALFAAYRLDETAIDHIESVERFMDLQWRAQRLFDELTLMPHESILVVAHGALGRALRRAAHGQALHERGDYLENAVLYKFV